MDKAVINGKTYILVPEEVYNEETPEKPERARTGYERGSDNKRYYVDTLNNGVEVSLEIGHRTDNIRYNTGNYYNDEHLAKDNARADSIFRRMRQWQALNDVAVKRYDEPIEKYSLVWDASGGEMYVNTICAGCCIDNFEVYFSSMEKAQEALEVFRDDLIWLHTKYRRRLDEEPPEAESEK